MPDYFYHIIQDDLFRAMDRFDNGVIDFTITSPPFRDEDVPKDYYDWFAEFLEAVKQATNQYAFIFNSSTRLVKLCQKFNPDRILIWDKRVSKYSYKFEPILVFNCGTDLKINKRIYTDIFHVPPVIKPKVRFMNPVPLLEKLIKMVTREGEVILDSCGGSGTTMFAAQNQQRSCVVVEVDPIKCQYIKRRCFPRRFLTHETECEFIAP